MQFHPNELFLYYDPSSRQGKQVLAMAKSIARNVNAVDYRSIKLTSTVWKEIVNMIKLEPKKLLDKSRKDYQDKIAGNTFTMDGWLEVLVRNPQMLKGPVAIYNGKVAFCLTPTDVLRLDANSRTSSKVPPHLRRERP